MNDREDRINFLLKRIEGKGGKEWQEQQQGQGNSRVIKTLQVSGKWAHCNYPVAYCDSLDN